MRAPLALTAGAELGAYEIQSPLGAGGMGEVHRSRDPRLQRDVAPKLLSLSKCPDLVMDRGHYFAMELTPQELEDLIELLKTF